MIVRINGAGEPVVYEPGDVGHLAVVADPTQDLPAEGPFGRLDPDGEHVWLDVVALRAAAESRSLPDDWSDGFAGMVGYAASRGWLDDSGTALRAHVDRPVTAPPIATVLGDDYDHYDEAFALDPHEEYSQLRAQCPVGRSDNYGGFYVVSRYEDIDQVLHDPDTFSSYPADTPPPPTHTRRLPPFEVDPPDHRSYRRIVDPLFGPRRMNLLEPTLREAARSLLDALDGQHEFDFLESFAGPYPSAAFLSLIGLEADEALRDQLCSWVEHILHATTEGDEQDKTEVRVGAAKALRSFLSGVLEEKKDVPGTIFHDLFSATFGGERPLRRGEVLDFSYLLVLAGVDTVTTALGFSFLHLGRRPDLQAALVADRSLIPSAIEELLRFESAVHPSRTVMNPCKLGEIALGPGDRIVIPYASADRDESVFDRADQIILDRTPNRHLAFGGGPHRCLGSHLARLEMRVAFEEILDRIPEFSIPDHPPVTAFGGQTRSLVTLPFRTSRSSGS